MFRYIIIFFNNFNVLLYQDRKAILFFYQPKNGFYAVEYLDC